VKYDRELSAVGRIEGDMPLLIVGADEGQCVQILAQVPADDDTPQSQIYQVERAFSLLADFEPEETDPERCQTSQSGEIDIEGIAVEGNTVYVTGSHSRKRKTIKFGKTYAANRERHFEVAKEESRAQLFRFTWPLASGEKPERATLFDFFKENDFFKTFRKVPSKENGIDIEGLAVRDGVLYFGFRSPVTRGNLVPILKMRFGQPENHEILFVDIGGSGIRGMTAVENGFLILAGPSAEAPGDFGIYFWDGLEHIPGKGQVRRTLTHLAEVSTRQGVKPEGITVIDSDGDCHRVLVISDGAAKGHPRLMKVCSPKVL